MKSVSFLGCALLVMAIAGSAFAQSTGSRIKGQADQPLSIIRFEEPAEIARTRALIERGEVAAAIATAQGLLASDSAPDIQYFGHNALCVAHSAARDWGRALEACDSAIRIRPTHWMALNSRGTVHLMAGRGRAAVADYQKALRALPDDSAATDIVRHNLGLAEAQGDGRVS